MKVLVTGFDPFGGESINPAYEAVKMLPDEIAGAQIIKREIPTSFTRGTAEVVRQIELCQPDLVLNVGQAGGAAGLRVERVAINLRMPVSQIMTARSRWTNRWYRTAPRHILPSCRSRPWCAGCRQRAIPASCLTRQVLTSAMRSCIPCCIPCKAIPIYGRALCMCRMQPASWKAKLRVPRPCRWQTLPRPWQLPLKPLCRIRPI